jgi:diguanylate cyclase (GGDEF)-like protein
MSHHRVLGFQRPDSARGQVVIGIGHCMDAARVEVNLHGYAEIVERVRADEQAVYAVLFLDFDRFKFTNDTLGHSAGDELLRQIAARLRGGVRGTDLMGNDPASNLVGRFGGDEFLVLINDLKTPGDATVVAARLLDSLTGIYSILGYEVQSTAHRSIGVERGVSGNDRMASHGSRARTEVHWR